VQEKSKQTERYRQIKRERKSERKSEEKQQEKEKEKEQKKEHDNLGGSNTQSKRRMMIERKIKR